MMISLTEKKEGVDMLRYIVDKEKKIILVAIDYAGLTTNCEDMKKIWGKCKPEAYKETITDKMQQ